MKRTLLVALFYLITKTLTAQNNLPDPTFSEDGFVVTPTNIASEEIGTIAVAQTQQLTLIGGRTAGRLVVARFNTLNNTLDSSFGVNGIFMALDGHGYGKMGNANLIKILEDGKILIAGTFALNQSQFILIKLNADGTPDATFGDDGVIDTGYTNITLTGLDVQNDERIVVSGYALENNSSLVNKINIFRFNADGTSDISFDLDGRVVTSVGTGNDYVNSIKIQTDSKIVICGSTSISQNSSDILLARYNVNGTMDTSFDTDGIVVTSISSTGGESGKSIELQGDGKIVVGGSTPDALVIRKLVVLRYNVDGTLDSGFGVAGQAITSSLTSNDSAIGVSIDNSGAIYISGKTNYTNNGIKIIKYNAAGQRINSYGTLGNGISLTSSAVTQNINFVYLNPDNTMHFGGTQGNHFLFEYFNSSGVNTSNFLPENLGLTRGVANNVAYLPDGKYLTSGYCAGPIMVKYNANGTVDQTFGNSGFYNFSTGWWMPASDMVVREDGKIILGSSTSLIRINADGTTDTSFGNLGLVTLTQLFAISQITVLPDNGILIAGQTMSNDYFTILKLTSEGIPDPTFGENGVVQITIGTLALSAAIVVQNDNKIVCYGVYVDIKVKPCIIRLMENGSLDPTFGTGGITLIPGIENVISAPVNREILITQDDKFVISGSTTDPVESFLAKFNNDGVLDAEFGISGILLSLPFSRTCCLTNNNKILLAGNQITQYDMSGMLDTNFGSSGDIEIFNGIPGRFVSDIHVQPDNKIIASINDREEYTTARFLPDTDLGEIDFTSTNGSMYIYPNPVNETTNLKYELSKETSLSIELFDMQGKLLTTYFSNALQSAGQYDQNLILPQHLQSGNYILKVYSGDGANSIKINKK